MLYYAGAPGTPNNVIRRVANSVTAFHIPAEAVTVTGAMYEEVWSALNFTVAEKHPYAWRQAAQIKLRTTTPLHLTMAR